MSLIPILIMYKAAQENASYGRRTSSQKSNDSRNSYRRTESKPLTKEEFISDEKNYRYERLGNYVLSELAKNDKVVSIINKIIGQADIKEKELIAQDEARIAELAVGAKLAKEEYQASCEELRALGFELSELDEEGIYSAEPSNEKRKFSYTAVRLYGHVDGLELTREQVTSGENPYEKRYLEHKAKHPNAEEEYIAAYEEVKKLSKWKLVQKVSETRREKLEIAQQRLKVAREILDKETKYQAQAEFYASLTAEEKEILLNYFDKAENLSQKAQQISDLRTDVLLKEGYYYTYDKRQCEQYSEYKDAILTEAVESLTEEEAEILEEFYENIAEDIVSSTIEELKAGCNSKKAELMRSRNTHLVADIIVGEIRNKALELSETKQEDCSV